jgi:hypothetical protein
VGQPSERDVRVAKEVDMEAGKRPIGLAVGAAAVAASLLLASANLTGVANAKPKPAAGVTVVTLTGEVTVTEPGTMFEIAFEPTSGASFTQMPGQVVNVSMKGEAIGDGDGELVFCDVFAAVQVTNVYAATAMPFSMRETVFIAQRGGAWWEMTEESANLSRTIPAPATATNHTIVGVAWMGEVVGEEPDCYGTQYGGEHVDFTVPVRVSIVTLTGS